MDTMLQMQADQLGVTVRRPVDQETTALGAAYLAGLAEGVWPSLDAVAAAVAARRRVRPAPRPHLHRPRHDDVAARRRALAAAGPTAARSHRGQLRSVGCTNASAIAASR